VLQVTPHVGLIVGPRVGINNEWGAVYPATGADFTARTGLTLDSLYAFQESSGNLLDKAGAQNLTAQGTPTYSVMLGGRQGIYYDAASDRHEAAVYDPGTSSLLAFCVCANPGATTGGVMGGYDQSDALDGWIVYRTANKFEFHVRSSALGGNKSVVSTTTIAADRLYLVSIQIDRAANTCRARVTPSGGASEALTLDITGMGTLSGGVNHKFGFGSLAFLSAGVRVFYGGIKSGVGAQGAAVLSNLHHSLGWE
jgi:hypothetical protein